MSIGLTTRIGCGLLLALAMTPAGAAAEQATPPTPRMIQVPPVPPAPPAPPVPPVPALAPFDLSIDIGPFDLPPVTVGPFDVPRIAVGPVAVGPIDLSGISTTIAALAPLHGMVTSRHGMTPEDRADELYEQGREAIESGRYERAISRFDDLIALKTNRTDAALYWKAYAQNKLGQRTEALTTIGELTKGYADSRWLRDARALEVEIRQSSGQAVPPETQSDEELKLLALRGLMQSDPDRAMPAIERILGGTGSIKLKEQAIFVLSQSRSTRAREILTNIAKGGSNPDLQLRAIRYIGVMGGADSRQILDDAYRTSADAAVKRAILRSFMTSGDRARLVALAKTEKDAALRGEAIQQLGVMRADTELADLYKTETSIELKKRILQAMFVGNSDRLIDLAKTEREPELRRSAIRTLGLIHRPGSTEALTSIYASDADPGVRKAVIDALFVQQNATALITLARNEKDAAMKKEIVGKLSVMPKSKEVTDFLMELLK